MVMKKSKCVNKALEQSLLGQEGPLRDTRTINCLRYLLGLTRQEAMVYSIASAKLGVGKSNFVPPTILEK